MESVHDAVVAKGLEIFRMMSKEPPEIFNRRWWAGRLMTMAMENPDLKVQLFRFIDVLPALSTTEPLMKHI
jgi:RHH-type proline utilization regulon transcriptional repressor/proline dehydrogenase/delta 1-pyrroline-5-carboxylate dehydrogenase